MPFTALAEGTNSEEKLLKLRYTGFVYPGEYETDIPYSDSFFLQDATQYSHPLARLSMGISIASFRWDFLDDPDSYADIKRFFGEMGFNDISLSDYDESPTLFTIASCIASKEIITEGESFTLVAVAICGGNYSEEWASNFTVASDDRHMGFASAAELVEDRVAGYLARQKLINKNIKLWVSGFSRAAAVANIVGADLTDMELCPASDIFVYTFATPRVTKRDTGNYDNIFNIIGKQDIITRFSPGDWGYARYGREFYTPSQETDSDYSKRSARAAAVFDELLGKEWWNNPGSNLDLRLMYDYFINAFPDSENYVKVIQEPLVSLTTDKSRGNIIRQLKRLLYNPELTKEQNHAIRDFLKYMLGMALGDILDLGEQSALWKKGALMSGNAVHEHCLEVYLAWLFSSDDPEEIFTEEEDWIRVYTVGKGEFLVTLHETGELVETWMSPEKALDEMHNVLPEITLKDDFADYDFYYVWDDETFEQVLLVPCDENYDVWFLSEADQNLSGTAAWFPSFLKKDVCFRSQTIPASKGEAVLILNVKDFCEGLSADLENGKSSISPKEEAELLQFEQGKELGHKALIVALVASVFVLCLFILLVWFVIHSIRRLRRADRSITHAAHS